MYKKLAVCLLGFGLVISDTALASPCNTKIHILNKSRSDLRVISINTFVDKAENYPSSITLSAEDVIGRKEEKISDVASMVGTHGNVAGIILLSSVNEPDHILTLHYRAVKWFPWYCSLKTPTISSTSPNHFLAAQLTDDGKEFEFHIYGN